MTDSAQRCQKLVQLASRAGVLLNGEFELKSGRKSSYFFDMGAISRAEDLAGMGRLYADAVNEYWPENTKEQVEVLFGPAYKGIPLVVSTALALAAGGRSLPVAYDRKERKSHGEGGQMVGAELAGKRVLLIDDVLTAGTAVRHSLSGLQAAGAALCGVLVALDRGEPADEAVPEGPTAAEALQSELGIPVRAIATASDLLGTLG